MKAITFGIYICIVADEVLESAQFTVPFDVGTESGDLIQFTPTKVESGKNPDLVITNGKNGFGDDIFEDIKDLEVVIQDYDPTKPIITNAFTVTNDTTQRQFANEIAKMTPEQFEKFKDYFTQLEHHHACTAGVLVVGDYSSPDTIFDDAMADASESISFEFDQVKKRVTDYLNKTCYTVTKIKQ